MENRWLTVVFERRPLSPSIQTSMDYTWSKGKAEKKRVANILPVSYRLDQERDREQEVRGCICRP